MLIRPARIPTPSAPPGPTIRFAAEPIATPPASVAFWMCTCAHVPTRRQPQARPAVCAQLLDAPVLHSAWGDLLRCICAGDISIAHQQVLPQSEHAFPFATGMVHRPLQKRLRRTRLVDGTHLLYSDRWRDFAARRQEERARN